MCIVLCDTSLQEDFVDCLFDLLQQRSVRKDPTIHQQLQMPVDVCEQLLSNLALAVEYCFGALGEPIDLVRVVFWVCALQKALQVLAHFFTVFDIQSRGDPCLVIWLPSFVLCLSTPKNLEERGEFFRDFPKYPWNKVTILVLYGFVDLVGNLDNFDGAKD
jgi:hypothetical protein